MLRTIREIQPEWVVGENVRGLISWNGGLVFNEVQADLEAEGYEVLPFLLPASSVNAPHERYRVWFIAYNSNARTESLQQRWENGVYESETLSNPDKLNGNLSGFRTSEIPQFEASGVFGNNVTNTINEGLERSEWKRTFDKRKRKETSGSASKPIEIPTWDNWPTEFPVCGVNDGISSKLVGITFSKHRNESIKAYGNAIVPQLALQIFKAIEQFKQLTMDKIEVGVSLKKNGKNDIDMNDQIKYQVILADPPWKYRNVKTGGSMKSGSANKYPTLTTKEICAIDVPGDKNSVLFLWATVPMLPDALKVMEAWGYKYKTMITWRKIMSLGMGFWYRGQTEHLLFGIKGKVKAFHMQEPNFIQCKVEAHSKKPNAFRELIERSTPDMPLKLEMFAREKHLGWHTWGNEIENDVELKLSL